MRSWDTTAVPRAAGSKRAARLPLIALGAGIGIAGAVVVGMLVEDRQSSAPPQRVEVAPSSIAPSPPTPSEVPSATAEPDAVPEAIVAPAEAPVHSSSASAAPPRKSPPPNQSCQPKYYIDKEGYQRVKPWCQ
jgi:hypothetical protein